MTKTVDWKGTSHYYRYDELNRMEGHGATGSANDETYTWVCCTRMTAFTDSLGTASLSYDDLNRLTSFTDSQGNTVAYVYDEMGRVTRLTPAQGSGYKTEYAYSKNGSVAQVKTYVAGTPEDTDYDYDTTSGKLLRRDNPVVSSNHIRTSYAYDSAGRLEYETITREAGGTTNLYKRQYAYSYIAAGSGGGREVLRTEQTYSGGWVNDYKVNYRWNALEWMTYEQRHDWSGGAWAARYDIAQEYDKVGNRTRYHKNVQGATADYGRAMDLSHTFDTRNRMTAITDADDANYSCTVTSDSNLNITQIDEKMGFGAFTNHLYTDFAYDDLNRLTEHKTKFYVGGGHPAWMIRKRNHAYDGLGRLVYSETVDYPDGNTPGPPSTLQHTYDRERFSQNYDGTSSYGGVWHFAGQQGDRIMPDQLSPLKSPNPDTSQQAYNVADNTTPISRSFVDPTTEGDRQLEYGQGRPMAKSGTGSASAWAMGTTSAPQNGFMTTVESRVMFEGTVSATPDLGTDAREKGRIGIFGASNSFAGSSGRVTSESIGRDLNPLGRGDGNAYIAGWVSLGRVTAMIGPGPCLGIGNSVNNSIVSGGDGHRYSEECFDYWNSLYDTGQLNCAPQTCPMCPCFRVQCSDKTWRNKRQRNHCIAAYCDCKDIEACAGCFNFRNTNGFPCLPHDCVYCNTDADDDCKGALNVLDQTLKNANWAGNKCHGKMVYNQGDCKPYRQSENAFGAKKLTDCYGCCNKNHKMPAEKARCYGFCNIAAGPLLSALAACCP